MADPFSPNTTGADDSSGQGPDFYRNLMQFGLATMAAGAQRDANGIPMTTLGALGQGGLAAMQSGRQSGIDRTDLGLKKAQTENYQSENAAKRFGQAMQIQKYNMDADYAGLPRIDPSSFGLGGPQASAPGTAFGGGAGLPTGGGIGAPTGGAAGMSVSGTAGFAPAGSGNQTVVPAGSGPPVSAVNAAAAQPTPGGGLLSQVGAQRGAPSINVSDTPGASAGDSAPQYGQPPQGQSPEGQSSGGGNGAPHSIADIPLDVRRGATAPTPAQAAFMANYLDRSGHPEEAKALRSQGGLTPPQGFQFDSNYKMSFTPGGPADPAVVGQKAAAEAWAKVNPAIAQAGGEAWAKAPAQNWVDRMKPESFRGPGSARYDPLTGQTVQIPNEIKTVDANGQPITRFVPLGVDISGGPGQASGSPSSVPTGMPGSGGMPGPRPQTNAGTPPAPRAEPRAPVSQSPLPQGSPTPTAPSGSPDTLPNGYVTGLSPGTHEAIEGAAKNYNDEGKKTYQSAVDLKGSIEFIRRDLDKLGETGWTATGSGADLRMELLKKVNSALNVAGMPGVDPDKVGAWEDFTKEAKLGGMKGLSAIFGGSREAASIVQTSMSAFPHPENSYQGAKLLVNAFDEAANREIDKRNFETNWMQDHGGNLVGANEAFNTQYSAPMYTRRAISQVEPYEVKSPEEMRRYMPGTYIKTPGGVKMVPGATGVELNGQPQAQQ